MRGTGSFSARGGVATKLRLLSIEGARAAGASHLRILARHVLPNVVAPIVVQVSIGVAFALLAETALSFLGVGIKPPEPSWGTDVGRGYRFMRLAPWLVFMPGTTILLTALAFNWNQQQNQDVWLLKTDYEIASGHAPPKVVINDRVEFEGAYPEPEFLKAVLQAALDGKEA